MNISKIQFLILCALFLPLIGVSQNQIFSPQLWLSNPKDVKSTRQNFTNLNTYEKLPIDAKNLNSSINYIENNNHLFLVYRSEAPENIISILGRNKSLFLNSDKVKINDSVKLSGYNENYGELLDVKFGGMEMGKFWMNPKLDKTNIYEIILINGKSNFSANEIRTYLSLKYGIDLIDSKQYEYKKKKLWDGSNKKFNNHIFGIATLGAFSLKTKNTIHSKDQDLKISINVENSKKMQDGSFVLFGHNNKSLTINNSTKQSNKWWQVQTNVSDLKLDVGIPISKLHNFNASYKLIVGGEDNFRTYSGNVKDSLYVFKNVSFNKEANVFLRLLETVSDIELDINNTCDNFSVKVKPKISPNSYSIKIRDDQGIQVYNSQIISSIFTISNVSSKYYDIDIRYDGKILNRRISTYNSTLSLSTLKQNYKLEGENVKIVVANPNKFRIKWYKDSKIIGDGNTIDLNSIGNYSAKIIGDGECYHQQYFTVTAKYTNEQWNAFPNPLDENDDLNISFNLDTLKMVDAIIYTIDGKMVKQFSFGKIQDKTVNLGRIIGAKGTYMLVVYINNTPEFQKIILK